MASVIGSTVPDYRGLFLRGVGGNSENLGLFQEDTQRRMIASFSSHSPAVDRQESYAISTGTFKRSSSTPVPEKFYLVTDTSKKYHQLVRFTFDNADMIPTANENRPVNKSVRYLIRALE